jgi:hypothetical protein
MSSDVNGALHEVERAAQQLANRIVSHKKAFKGLGPIRTSDQGQNVNSPPVTPPGGIAFRPDRHDAPIDTRGFGIWRTVTGAWTQFSRLWR